MLRPGSLPSRLLALALLAAVPALAYVFVIEPVVAAYRGAGQAIVQAQGLLQSYRERAEQRPQLAQMLAEVEAQYERVRVLLGAEGGAGETVLPPLRPDTSAADSDPQEQAARSPSPDRSAGSTPRQPEG